MEKSKYSSEIKTEVLQIVEAFGLGKFIELLSFEESSKVDGYIFTQFETTLGRYNHYYRIKSNNELREVHNNIRCVLFDYGNEEYGDCIIDEICNAVGIEPTTAYYTEGE